MGNRDGIVSVLKEYGTNKVLHVSDGLSSFSFAFGNEIAFVYDNCYYILNCDEKLWNRLKEFVLESTTTEECKAFWLKESMRHEVNDYSGYFGDLQ